MLVLLGMPKTIAFNLRYLPLRQAVRLPVLVSHRVAFFDFNGRVRVPEGARIGTVLLGFGNNGAFDYKRSRSVWQVVGEVIFEGPARLGHGFKLSVAGRVTFGPDFVLNCESQIICRESITFGRGTEVAWDCMILDSDFHPILFEDGTTSTFQAPIVIGERVWVSTRVVVLKGVVLGDDVVVAAGTVLTRPLPESNVLVGGSPARVLRTGVSWSQGR
jgi:acetyltransferase-like isoleucine patch superfamily enzyme